MCDAYWNHETSVWTTNISVRTYSKNSDINEFYKLIGLIIAVYGNEVGNVGTTSKFENGTYCIIIRFKKFIEINKNKDINSYYKSI